MNAGNVAGIFYLHAFAGGKHFYQTVIRAGKDPDREAVEQRSTLECPGLTAVW